MLSNIKKLFGSGRNQTVVTEKTVETKEKIKLLPTNLEDMQFNLTYKPPFKTDYTIFPKRSEHLKFVTSNVLVSLPFMVFNKYIEQSLKDLNIAGEEFIKFLNKHIFTNGNVIKYFPFVWVGTAQFVKVKGQNIFFNVKIEIPVLVEKINVLMYKLQNTNDFLESNYWNYFAPYINEYEKGTDIEYFQKNTVKVFWLYVYYVMKEEVIGKNGIKPFEILVYSKNGEQENEIILKNYIEYINNF